MPRLARCIGAISLLPAGRDLDKFHGAPAGGAASERASGASKTGAMKTLKASGGSDAASRSWPSAPIAPSGCALIAMIGRGASTAAPAHARPACPRYLRRVLRARLFERRLWHRKPSDARDTPGGFEWDPTARVRYVATGATADMCVECVPKSKKCVERGQDHRAQCAKHPMLATACGFLRRLLSAPIGVEFGHGAHEYDPDEPENVPHHRRSQRGGRLLPRVRRHRLCQCCMRPDCCGDERVYCPDCKCPDANGPTGPFPQLPVRNEAAKRLGLPHPIRCLSAMRRSARIAVTREVQPLRAGAVRSSGDSPTSLSR